MAKDLTSEEQVKLLRKTKGLPTQKEYDRYKDVVKSGPTPDRTVRVQSHEETSPGDKGPRWPVHPLAPLFDPTEGAID